MKVLIMDICFDFLLPEPGDTGGWQMKKRKTRRRKEKKKLLALTSGDTLREKDSQIEDPVVSLVKNKKGSRSRKNGKKLVYAVNSRT